MKLAWLPGITGWMEANCRYLNRKKTEEQRFKAQRSACTGINPKYFSFTRKFQLPERKTL